MIKIEVSGEEVTRREDEAQEGKGRQEQVADALAVLDAAIIEHRPSVVYALFSGGHDSLTSTAIAAKHPAFTGVIHINTGIGIEETREFVRATCEEQQWPLYEVRAAEGLYEELVLTRGGFPGGVQAHNSMLWYLKQQPLGRWLRGIEGHRLGLVTGIRKQESVRRMGAGISVPVRRKNRQVWISPILEWSRLDCGRFMHEEGLPRSPVVDLIHRSGECLCGALARQEERLEIARWFPDVNARINRLERACEERGLAASVWAGRNAERLTDGQEQLFSSAEYAPLCTSCEAAA